jgi:hypothetical protein
VVKLLFLDHIDVLPESAVIEVEEKTHLAEHTVMAVLEHLFEAVSIVVGGAENEIEQMQHGVEGLLTKKGAYLQKGEVEYPLEEVADKSE